MVPILVYHDVNLVTEEELGEYAVTPNDFSEQMRWLRRSGREAITLSDLAALREGSGALPERLVIITFDDGVRSCLDHAGPSARA